MPRQPSLGFPTPLDSFGLFEAGLKDARHGKIPALEWTPGNLSRLTTVEAAAQRYKGEFFLGADCTSHIETLPACVDTRDSTHIAGCTCAKALDCRSHLCAPLLQKSAAYVPNMCSRPVCAGCPECYTARASSTCSVVQERRLCSKCPECVLESANDPELLHSIAAEKATNVKRNSSGCTAWAPLAACRTTRSTSARRTRRRRARRLQGRVSLRQRLAHDVRPARPGGARARRDEARRSTCSRRRSCRGRRRRRRPARASRRRRRRRRRHRRRRRRRASPRRRRRRRRRRPPSAPSVLGNLWRVMWSGVPPPMPAPPAPPARPGHSRGGGRSAANGARRCEILRRFRVDLLSYYPG